MKWSEAAVTAGVITGYGTTVAQLTDGPYSAFRRLRGAFITRVHGDASHLEALAYCGWCLAPYATLPVYIAVRRSAHVRGHWVVGYLLAVAVAGFSRHVAELA